MINLNEEWKTALADEIEKPYFKTLWEQVTEEYKTNETFPPVEDIFNAFNYAPLSKVKCVIIGQDPYHNEHQAHGLSFSVLPEQKELFPGEKNSPAEIITIPLPWIFLPAEMRFFIPAELPIPRILKNLPQVFPKTLISSR